MEKDYIRKLSEIIRKEYIYIYIYSHKITFVDTNFDGRIEKSEYAGTILTTVGSSYNIFVIENYETESNNGNRRKEK